MSSSTPTPGSTEPAQPRSSERPSTSSPRSHEADATFFDALRSAGLLSEFSPELFASLVTRADAAREADARRLDVLELYFGATGEVETSRRRSRADRMIVHHAGFGENATSFIARLGFGVPELPGLRAERMGSDEGPLVLRCGEHVAAVLDEEEHIDGLIAIRGIVQAVNILLDRVGVEKRLVLLRADGEREMYVCVGSTQAYALCQSGILEEDDWAQLCEASAW